MTFPSNESNCRALAPSRGLTVALRRGRIVLLDERGRVVYRATNWSHARSRVLRWADGGG